MCFKYVLAVVSKSLLLINQTVVGGRCCCRLCSPGGETEAPRGEKPEQVMVWLVFWMQPRQPGLSIAARSGALGTVVHMGEREGDGATGDIGVIRPNLSSTW